MSREHILQEARQSVDHLLGQYRDYLATQERVRASKTKLTQLALAMARDSGQPFPLLLQELPGELRQIQNEIAADEHELATISDAMTFANPMVWMQYKFEAYAGTSQAIVDMDDFRKHCSKPGYICTKRYQFLGEWLKARGLDLDDVTSLAGSTPLSQAYCHELILSACADAPFMKDWDGYEYNHASDGSVAKWENYPA